MDVSSLDMFMDVDTFHEFNKMSDKRLEGFVKGPRNFSLYPSFNFFELYEYLS